MMLNVTLDVANGVVIYESQGQEVVVSYKASPAAVSGALAALDERISGLGPDEDRSG